MSPYDTFRLYILGGNIIEREICPFHHILWGSTQLWLALLLKMVILFPWLRWYLPGFSSGKLLRFLLGLVCILWKILWDCVNIPFLIRLLPTNFSIHLWFLDELYPISLAEMLLFWLSSVLQTTTIKKSVLCSYVHPGHNCFPQRTYYLYWVH